MYTTPLYISQKFNHEFNHLRDTLHLPSTGRRGKDRVEKEGGRGNKYLRAIDQSEEEPWT